jgi:hypothetical protein
MSNSHTLTPSRSHARPSRAARLVSLFRGHDDMPEAPDADLQDHGDGMDIAEAIGALPESEPWWGLTEIDFPPAHDRPYVPDPLGQFPRYTAALDPGPQADLGGCLIFRDTVRAVFVRQEEARGFHAPDVPWHERYAGLYRARTAEPVIGTFGIADAAREAHEEAKAAFEANIQGRIDRITAPVDPDVTEGTDEDEEHGTEAEAA